MKRVGDAIRAPYLRSPRSSSTDEQWSGLYVNKTELENVIPEFSTKFQDIGWLVLKLCDELFLIQGEPLFPVTCNEPERIVSIYDGMVNALNQAIAS
jgi:hypothetical protein